MKEKFQELLDKYYDNQLSLGNFIFNFKLLHREKFKIDTEILKSELHPKLQKILPVLIKKIEKKTNLVYYGIYDGLEGKSDLKHYIVKFQNQHYFSVSVDLSVGEWGSCNNVYYVKDDNKIHMCIETSSCSSLWGEYNFDDKKIIKELLLSIIRFDEKYGGF